MSTAFVKKQRRDGKIPVTFAYSNGVRLKKLIAPDKIKEVLHGHESVSFQPGAFTEFQIKTFMLMLVMITVLSSSILASTPTKNSKALVNINTCSIAELQGVPGIGAVMAKRIIDNRPYTKIEDLQRVKSIGTGKRYSTLIRNLVVSDTDRGRRQE
jgi:hypothetical protein